MFFFHYVALYKYVSSLFVIFSVLSWHQNAVFIVETKRFCVFTGLIPNFYTSGEKSTQSKWLDLNLAPRISSAGCVRKFRRMVLVFTMDKTEAFQNQSCP